MIDIQLSQFAKDVIEGLSVKPKRLSSKYFYDEKGDKLFQQIMNLEEYYLTRTEYTILSEYKQAILEQFSSDSKKFNLIEFGAGDGYKTKVLLKHFIEKEIDFTYMPIDISGNVLGILKESLKNELPELKVEPLQNEYFKALSDVKDSPNRNVVLFLGSNIGNFTSGQAIQFLQELNATLKTGDLVFIGFDLKKDPDVILAAYNDSKGITAEFNFNLLDRINRELGGNFDRSKFIHIPIYNPSTGITSSFLVSTEKQTVKINDKSLTFDAWEAVHMEISQKYDQSIIDELASQADFEIIEEFTDEKNYFLNSVWRK